MVLPSKGPGQPLRCRWRALAERNQSVAAVGAWVESAPGQQSPAFASASRVEEELKEQQQQKAASLRRFQGEVRQRVNRQARLRRRLELQKAYEAVERENCAAVQYSTPWKNTCLFQSLPAAIICAPSGCDPAQPEEEHGEPFQQQAAELSRAVQQVRRRLASRRILSHASHGAWRQQDPDPCPAPAVPMEEGEELLLAGHHDLPAELLEQGTAARATGQDDGFYIKIEFKKVCGGTVKDSSPPGRPHSECQPPLRLWAGVEQEETRKQRQSEFLRCRRLCMALERERVRQRQRQQDRQHRVAQYLEALRAQMREKVKLCNIDLPPLCSCGSDFWDSHPDTCANNCIFYKNHKAYSQVLHSVISSCGPAAPRSLQDLAALCARSGRRL
ncbi:coiled-coil domain-containing protein 15 isoform X2 [Melozone crissalis]|uniref:coiled-coil domain-containing protein 15 isoform X2 n=1 Tax=Melozone crissalis TaxID=40204 RepID=UPI0023DBBD02|nr:coiled-coil domain-containing protein 15 isoform X2 [Melozone crissalis]